MHTRLWLWLCVAAAQLLGACDGEVSVQTPDPAHSDKNPVMRLADASAVMSLTDAGSVPPSPLVEPSCRPVAAEPVPAQAKIMQPGAGGVVAAKMIGVDELFFDFKRFCSPCHTENSDGRFQVTSADMFAANVDMLSLDRMRSSDRRRAMPQGGSVLLLSERDATDPVRTFEANLAAWFAAGKPASFPDPSATAPADGPATQSFQVTPALGGALTNMGSCIPAKRIMYSEPALARSDELDALFASATGLPDLLSQTDLFTLDSETLAKHGTISYAPTYTLWADDAKKMRYVRVPRGQSISFSVATQSFTIPDNTRFYKTFLKEVKDVNGKVGYKKIETRVILVRKAEPGLAGQPDKVNALFGTYLWNEDESEAELVKRRLNNGEGFTDVVLDYIPDEAAAQARIDELNSGRRPPTQTAIDLDLFAKGLKRHYAVPGSERCVQCHMGGPDGSFVLAFNPLQVVRRPLGEGGVIEPAGPDELNQLQRLIDYGVITGVESPAKILPLEKSQGARSPRTKYELIAQGYMLGNCAHCHTKKGFATVQSQGALAGVFDLFPSASGGGIFEFPLDRFSPRIQRGPSNARSSIPYITPSLYDQQDDYREGKSGLPYVAASYGDGEASGQPVLAPWRSLIYRNVDSPYVYAAKGTIFPHMPMNTPGFDCRAPRIMAEWMVSIPARQSDKFAVWYNDRTPQPMQEVRPGTPDYDAALLQAELRLAQYRSGGRYEYCPDTTDIIDVRTATAAVRNEKPNPDRDEYGFPKRPHFVETDLTEKPGSWAPRQPKWEDYLLHDDVSWVDGDGNVGETERDVKKLEQTKMLSLLRSTRLSSDFRKLATERVAFGLWQKKSGCDFSTQPTVGALQADPAWSWLEEKRKSVSASDPVYMQAPGEAIFKQICVNCHGSNADSRGRQADTVLLLTGGSTRVANFRAGLFGPADAPGSGRSGVFGALADAISTSDDWSARYLSWMALGGTTKPIPSEVLAVVGQESVLGVVPPRIVPASPNMLTAALAACSYLLPMDPGKPLPELMSGQNTFKLEPQKNYIVPSGVIIENGDADLWRRICTYENELPIRVVGPIPSWSKLLQQSDKALSYGTDGTNAYVGLYRRRRQDGSEVYPSDAPVGNHRGLIQRGIQPDNQAPMCVRRPTDPAELALATPYVEAAKMVFCPVSMFETAADGSELHRLTYEEMWNWARRGAINAGFAVFSYLDAFTKGEIGAQPAFDQCEQLGAGTK